MTTSLMDVRTERWPGLADLLPDDPTQTWKQPHKPQGVPAVARSYLLAALRQELDRPILLIAEDDNRADLLLQEIRLWSAGADDQDGSMFYFAKPDARPYERIPWTGQTRQSRLTALAALLDPPPGGCLVVSSVEALMQVTLPPAELAVSLHTYRRGDRYRVSDITREWVDAGYIPEPLVESAGTFSHRGNILDIWPANLLFPVRLDFFGDDIDTLRIFDPQTQRSKGPLTEVSVGPASEALARFGPELLRRVGMSAGTLNAPSLVSQNPSLRGPLQDPGLSLFLQEEITAEVQKLHRQENFHQIEWYLPYMYEVRCCLLDYLATEGLLILDDGASIEQAVKSLERQNKELQTELIQSGEVPARFASSHYSYDEMLERLEAQQPLVLGHGDLQGQRIGHRPGLGQGCKALDLQQNPQEARPARIGQMAAAGTEVLIVSQMGPKVLDMLQATDLVVECSEHLPPEPTPGSILLLEGGLQGGFNLTLPTSVAGEEGPWLQVISDVELFDVSKVYRRRHHNPPRSITPEQFFAEVAVSDNVVHVDFGIGLYAGLVKRNLKGVETEYIQVDFQGGDKVLVPVHQADRVSRYVGAEDPVLNRLGSSRWATAKEKVKKEVQDIAGELLQIYAQREAATGQAAGQDDALQNALEMRFPYAETRDQLQAIEEVKADLEISRHMDRLIVGDVGFGKTEVAIRAAFKMVLDDRQVAVLVPTTVLAHQHYATFDERMKEMPVRMEVLSRLRSTSERRAVKEALAQGQLDIVIGTHALLSKDVLFKDLGLLIIDEEQRFGVKQKERLKRLKPSVNVLTMSATPIPRTMNMGLSGIRDISYITTPPEERLPVHTVMAPFDRTLVRKALERELNRKGQSFVVTDKVRGIVGLADEVSRLVPGASIDIAHGQMKGEELEDAMMGFAQGQTDILVCTTIIENGLDIPNANTMVVNNADRFGMAQLYQLRGRVGRSYKRGHCYLLYAEGNVLSHAAQSRLQNIVESSDELGAGFRIAMSDLQLRGAGEILGARQSGNMGAIGLDLYTRLLSNAVEELKSREDGTASLSIDSAADTPASRDPFTPAVTLVLPLDARIPEWYIEDNATRYRFYHRIAGLNSDQESHNFRQELIDRFGSVSQRVDAIPEEIENLLYQIQVKRAAEAANMEAISHRDPELLLKPNWSLELFSHRIAAMLGRVIGPDFPASHTFRKPYRIGRDGIYLTLSEGEAWRTHLLQILAELARFQAEVRLARQLA